MTAGAVLAPPPTVHATAIVLGEHGLLIRGRPGSGKSTLAHALVGGARATGRLGAFVADDRVALSTRGGRLVARAPGTIAGLAELAGWGILAVDHEAAVVVRLVVDLVDPQTLARMPEPGTTEVHVDGVLLVRQAAPARAIEVSRLLVAAALRALDASPG